MSISKHRKFPTASDSSEWQTVLPSDAGPFLLVLSAKNTERLKGFAWTMVDYINERRFVDTSSLCYTLLQTTNDKKEEQLVVMFYELEELKDSLIDYINGYPPHNVYTGNVRRDINSAGIFSKLVDKRN